MKRGLLPILSAVFSLSFCLATFGGVTADGDPVTNTTGEVAVLKGDAKLQSTLNAPINLISI